MSLETATSIAPISLPKAQKHVVPSVAGAILTLSPLLGSMSTVTLLAASDPNITLAGNTLSSIAPIAYGVSQTAYIRETAGLFALEYPVTVTAYNNAIVLSKANKIGINLAPPTYYVNYVPFTNLARNSNWVRTDYGVENDPTYIDAAGNLILMRATYGYYKFINRPALGTGYYRITWTGSGVLSAAYASAFISGDTNGSLSTISSSANNVIIKYTPYPYDPDNTSGFTIQFSNTTAANPVMNLQIYACDVNGNALYTGEFNPDYLAILSNFEAIRPMDWQGINTPLVSLFPVTWAQRTPANISSSPQFSDWIASSVTIGTMKLTCPKYLTSDSTTQLTQMAATGLGHPLGANGNLIAVTILAPSGSGATTTVTGTFPTGVTITIAPPSTVTTEAQLASYINSNAICAYWFSASSSATTAPPTCTGTQLSGGKNPINVNGAPIETLVNLANQSNTHLHYIFTVGATDDFVLNALTYIRDNLKSTLKLKMALGNEVWDSASAYVSGWIYCGALGLTAPSNTGTDLKAPSADPYSAFRYGYAYRYKQIATMAKTVFAATPNRLERVVECIQQGGSTSFTTTVLGTLGLSQYADTVDVAHYEYTSLNGSGAKGQWLPSTAYSAGDYVSDFATYQAYYAPVAYTSSSSLATDISTGNMVALTMPVLRSIGIAGQTSALNNAVNFATLINGYTNDRGNVILYGAYEGGASGPDSSFPGPNGLGAIFPNAISYSGTTVTVTLPTSYTGQAVVGDKVNISGNSISALNGLFLITGVSGATFTFTTATTPTGTTSTSNTRMIFESNRATVTNYLVNYYHNQAKFDVASFGISEYNRRIPYSSTFMNFELTGGRIVPNANHNYQLAESQWTATAIASRLNALKAAAAGKMIAYIDPTPNAPTLPLVFGPGYAGSGLNAVPLTAFNAVSQLYQFIQSDGTVLSTGLNYIPAKSKAGASISFNQTITDAFGTQTSFQSNSLTLGPVTNVKQFNKGTVSYTIPADFDPNGTYSVEITGAGGLAPFGSQYHHGGGGGGYALEDRGSALNLNAGDVITVSVAAAGSNADSYFKSNTIVKASAGTSATSSSATGNGKGGTANVGRVTYNGGDGGICASYYVGAGGGGAAGPNGAGANGRASSASSGGGGGSANGGSIASATGQNGGANRFGVGGGVGGTSTVPPTNGINGGGGAGAGFIAGGPAALTYGSNGSMDIITSWRDSVTLVDIGPGSGGGGSSGYNTGIYNGTVCSAGGPGGGAGAGFSGQATIIGLAGDGLIVFKYTPLAS